MKDIHIPNNAIITVAGTVGVGKSTLTKALAKRLGFHTSLEEVDENPYLYEPRAVLLKLWSKSIFRLLPFPLL